MRRRRQLYPYTLPRSDAATSHHDPHHAGFSDELAIAGFVQHGSHQAVLEFIDLRTWIAQAREPDNGLVTQMQFRAFWQPQQINAVGRDVLTQGAWHHVKTLRTQVVKQLIVHQMNLAQIRCKWIFRHTRTVFDSDAAVRIALDTVALNQLDDVGHILGKVMTTAAVDCNDSLTRQDRGNQ